MDIISVLHDNFSKNIAKLYHNDFDNISAKVYHIMFSIKRHKKYITQRFR
jgi:hypothetical protein